MTTSTLTTNRPADLEARQRIGEQANGYAARGAFTDYLERKAANTTRRQRAELNTLAEYLKEAGIETTGEALQTTGAAWAGITFGLVEGFIRWQLAAAFAIGTINARLSTVKRYAGLAFKAGAIDHMAYALIKNVQGYTNKEAINVDKGRTADGQPTRQGNKKAEHTPLTDRQADALKAQDLTTPQGRRDAVLMTILLDHGLRVGELVGLQVSNVDFEHKQLKFYRPKVNKTQTHDLTPATLAALVTWRDSGDMPLAGSLLRGSRKGGRLTTAGMSERAVCARVRALGEALGIDALSPHDCRHHWATVSAQRVESGRATLFNLQEAGGWNSLAMPRRYVEAASVANKNLT